MFSERIDRVSKNYGLFDDTKRIINDMEKIL